MCLWRLKFISAESNEGGLSQCMEQRYGAIQMPAFEPNLVFDAKLKCYLPGDGIACYAFSLPVRYRALPRVYGSVRRIIVGSWGRATAQCFFSRG